LYCKHRQEFNRTDLIYVSTIFYIVANILFSAIIKSDYRRQAAGKVIVAEIANQELEITAGKQENLPDLTKET
jgi:hypothetical protein